MTERFIIDENVAILAQKVENAHGEADNTCRQLVDNIIEICHSLVFDGVLWDKIYQQLRKPPPRPALWPAFIVADISSGSGKRWENPKHWRGSAPVS